MTHSRQNPLTLLIVRHPRDNLKTPKPITLDCWVFLKTDVQPPKPKTQYKPCQPAFSRFTPVPKSLCLVTVLKDFLQGRHPSHPPNQQQITIKPQK